MFYIFATQFSYIASLHTTLNRELSLQLFPHAAEPEMIHARHGNAYKVTQDNTNYFLKPCERNSTENYKMFSDVASCASTFSINSGWKVNLCVPLEVIQIDSKGSGVFCVQVQSFVQGETLYKTSEEKMPLNERQKLWGEVLGSMHSKFMNENNETLLHNDTHGENALLDFENKIVNVIDWDRVSFETNIAQDVYKLFEWTAIWKLVNRTLEFEVLENLMKHWIEVFNTYLNCFDSSKHAYIKKQMQDHNVPVELTDFAKLQRDSAIFGQALVNFIKLEKSEMYEFFFEKYPNYKLYADLQSEQQQRLWEYLGLSHLTEEQKNKVVGASVGDKWFFNNKVDIEQFAKAES